MGGMPVMSLTERVAEIERSMLELAGSLDPDGIPAREAPGLFARLDRIARAATAARTLLARRVDDSLVWEQHGFRSAVEHLAATTGASLGDARAELETSKALPALPTIRRALVAGDVSASQGAIIADAAKVNPSAESQLVQAAATTNLRELREQAGRAKAAADADPSATHARIHQERRVTRFTDGQGALHLHAVGTADEGVEVLSELDRLTDEIFHERRTVGARECRDAYVWDALVRMARRSRHGSAVTDRATNPRFLGLLRVDVEALHRGHVEGGELCEISGVGAVPVDVAKRLLGDATLKLVITRGVDVLNVTSLGRGPTAAMRYAMAWSSPTCIAEGCSRTIVEYDHRTGAEFATTHHTRLDEIDKLCTPHHDLHTHHGWALVAGTGKRPMVPPGDPRHPTRTGADPPGDPPSTPASPELELQQAASAAVSARRARQAALVGSPADA